MIVLQQKTAAQIARSRCGGVKTDEIIGVF